MKKKEDSRLEKFGARFDTLRKDTGLSHLQLANAIGVERSTVSKIFKGIKSVSQWDRISQICRELCLPSSTVRELRTLYELEYYGEDVQTRHQTFARLMDCLALTLRATSQQTKTAPALLPEIDKCIQPFHGTDSVLPLCRALILEEFPDKSESVVRVSSSVSVSSEIMRLLGARYNIRGKLIIRHMIALDSRNTESTGVNFDSICAIVPILLSDACSYSAHYYYCTHGASAHNPFPIYIVNEQRVMLISEDFSEALVITDPNVVEHYRHSFDRMLTTTRNIRAYKKIPLEVLSAEYIKSVANRQQETTLISALPSISRLLDIDAIHTYMKNPSADISDAVIELNAGYWNSSSSVHFTTLEGLDRFIDTGCCVSPQHYIYNILPIEARLIVLERMREAITTGSRLRIIRSGRLNIPFDCCIEHIAGAGLTFIVYNPADGTASHLRIEEASTVEAADSFFQHLSESLLTYDTDEAAAQIDLRIATLLERLRS